MTAARDVVAHIESRLQAATEMQVLKLAYYAQGWNIAWEGRPLFDDRIEAWKYGPVPVTCRNERKYGWPVQIRPLSDEAREVVDPVIEFYGHLGGPQLAELSHAEGSPWKEARGDIPDDAPSQEEITVASMRRFFTREALKRVGVPRRASRHVPLGTERVLEIAEGQAQRWQGTLARLADR
jgi:uncharacterized phage-associated protein